eukprot:2735629-Rhodomonas_salina.2
MEAYALTTVKFDKVPNSAICLRASYAMSGNIAYDAACLRASYAVSGTDIPCGTKDEIFEPNPYGIKVISAISLRACYTMSDIDLDYGLSLICDVRY